MVLDLYLVSAETILSYSDIWLKPQQILLAVSIRLKFLPCD